MARRVSRDQMRKIKGGTSTVAPQPKMDRPVPAKMISVKLGDQAFQVTPEQKKAFDALPKELQTKLRAPKKGEKISMDMLKADTVKSTIMCAW